MQVKKEESLCKSRYIVMMRGVGRKGWKKEVVEDRRMRWEKKMEEVVGAGQNQQSMAW